MTNTMFTYRDVDPQSISDVQTLFIRLASRSYSISHRRLPSFEDHHLFVSSHPYRFWKLILTDRCIGSYYVTHSNSVGVDIDEDFYGLIDVVFADICGSHSALPPIKSIRGAKFHINVSSRNSILCSMLQQKGFVEIQRTFALD